jgi:hypothetical protein
VGKYDDRALSGRFSSPADPVEIPDRLFETMKNIFIQDEKPKQTTNDLDIHLLDFGRCSFFDDSGGSATQQ